MKIVYVCPSSGMYGDNVALLKIMPHLIKNGVEPFFVLPRAKRTTFNDEIERKGYPYIMAETSMPNTWSFLKSFRIFQGYVRRRFTTYRTGYHLIRKKVEDFQPDIIHSNCSFTRIGYTLAKDLNVPHLWHIREYGIEDAGIHYFLSKRSFIRKINSQNNYSVCITDDIYSYFGSSNKGNVVYDGVFSLKSLPPIPTTDEGYLLYVGRLTALKGVDQLIEIFLAYCHAHNNSIVLKIAGSGSSEFENYLKNLVTCDGQGKRIQFLGFRSDVYELMARAHGLIVPSNFEAFGFISAEAMFNGCPVIGHNVAGTKIQFENGVKFTSSEIGFRYNTEEELQDSIDKLINMSRSELMPMLNNAQQTVAHYYTAEKSASEILEKYKEIILNKI